METTFELRTLEAKDIAPVAAILSKIGVKEFKNAFPSELKTKEVEAVGMAVAFEIGGIILANYEKCQPDIFKLLASLSGMKITDVEKLPPAVFAEMIVAVVGKEEFKDFFSVVSKLLK